VTLRPEFALGHSEYNPFLFSAVEDEEGELPLTVMSALVRLGIDPWQEAARLSALPRDVAARSLAEAIAKLPSRACEAASLAATATRLVSWLPVRGVSIAPTGSSKSTGSTKSTVSTRSIASILSTVVGLRAERPEVSRMGDEKSRSRLTMLLFWMGLVIAVYLVAGHWRGDNNLEPAGQASVLPTEQLNR
jgi:hypothetical protein